MYQQQNVPKRQKKESNKVVESNENFPGIGKIEYRPEGTVGSDDVPFYRYYNASERIHGRTMEEWLKPSIFIGNWFCPHHGFTPKPWSDSIQNVDNCKRSIKAFFEFCLKLGIRYWSAYDRNLSPEGDTLEETQQNLDTIAEFVFDLQQRTGIKPLWIAPDLKENFRYKKGACTNPDAFIATYAGYQVKKSLELAHKLQSECYLFPVEQEGYDNILFTDVHKEMKHFHRFLKLIADYKDKIGYLGQLLIETAPENKEQYQNLHKYCYDVNSTMCFIKHYGLDRYYQLNVTPGHMFHMASAIYNLQGSIEICGEDLTNINNATLMMRCMLEKGVPLRGGLNFRIPNSSGFHETKEFVEHFVSSLDIYAKALRIAVKLINDGQFNKSIQMRYHTYFSGWGNRLGGSDVSLEDCEEQAKRLSPDYQTSSKQDHTGLIILKYMEALHK